MNKYLIYDSETTGLNIIKDKPFLFQYGIADEKLDLIKIETFKSDDLTSKYLYEGYLRTIPTLVGHNIKFDVHMAINDGFDIAIFESKNYIDTAVLARLVINHDKQADKTFSTALKKLAVRYLGLDAADEDKKLRAELSSLTSAHKLAMRDHFIAKGLWDTTLKSTESTKLLNTIYTTWTKVYHKYPQFSAERKAFLQANPAPTYEDCSNVVTYGETDIVLTHGLLKLWYPQVVKLQQVDTLLRASKATFPLVLMERKGLTVDVPRVLQDRNAIIKELSKTKIIDPRTNTELSVGQHAKLKDLYEYECGFPIESADKNTRAMIEQYSPAARTASYIAKLSKYLNTYITGILNKLVYVDGEYKVFTQYNMAGTITGRLSSDFQQFPKKPLELNDGSVVNIRAWFIVPKKDKYMFYFDYASMELRLQCEWTNVILGAPDINMARAFMPYKCILVGDKYYLEENPSQEWEEVDLHSMTASHAFPNVSMSDPLWHDHYRQLGKRANFAINYGAAAPKLVQSLKVDFPTAQGLVAGYKKSFAGVVAFGKWINKRVYSTDNIPNLMLRRYYSRNKHQLQNWLVQGSGADILLLKLHQVYEYIKDKPHWNFMISVHDEIGFTCEDIPEAQLIKEVAEIQSLMCHKFTAVDIVTDVEYTTTKWSEKKNWKGAID